MVLDNISFNTCCLNAVFLNDCFKYDISFDINCIKLTFFNLNRFNMHFSSLSLRILMIWSYLSLICLKTDKPLEAEQAYKYAIKLNLDNPELLEEIHSNLKIIYSIGIKTIISNLFFIKIFKKKSVLGTQNFKLTLKTIFISK